MSSPSSKLWQVEPILCKHCFFEKIGEANVKRPVHALIELWADCQINNYMISENSGTTSGSNYFFLGKELQRTAMHCTWFYLTIIMYIHLVPPNAHFWNSEIPHYAKIVLVGLYLEFCWNST